MQKGGGLAQRARGSDWSGRGNHLTPLGNQAGGDAGDLREFESNYPWFIIQNSIIYSWARRRKQIHLSWTLASLLPWRPDLDYKLGCGDIWTWQLDLGERHACVKDGCKPLLSRRISQLETARQPLSVSFSGDWKGERGLGGLGKGSLTPRCRNRAEPGTRGQPPSRWVPARTLQIRRAPHFEMLPGFEHLSSASATGGMSFSLAHSVILLQRAGRERTSFPPFLKNIRLCLFSFSPPFSFSISSPRTDQARHNKYSRNSCYVEYFSILFK